VSKKGVAIENEFSANAMDLEIKPPKNEKEGLDDYGVTFYLDDIDPQDVHVVIDDKRYDLVPSPDAEESS